MMQQQQMGQKPDEKIDENKKNDQFNMMNSSFMGNMQPGMMPGEIRVTKVFR